MRKHVSTYEEAVRLHYEFIDSPIAEHNRGVYRKQVALAFASVAIPFVVLGIYTGYPLEFSICTIPAVALVTTLMYIPYHSFKKAVARIKDGSYFDDKDPAEIIEAANRYIDSYNEHVGD